MLLVMWCPVTSQAGLYKESMDGIKELIKSFLGIVLVVAVSFLIGCRYGRKTARKPVDLRVVWDTTEVVRLDTIVREKPVYVASYIHDTVRTYFTTIEQDTVTVDVPIERRVYHEDSLYHAVVSGPRCGNYEPSLDSLVVWPTITTVTIRDTKTEYRNSKISFGIQAGYGAFGKDFSPYIGVGISYNLFSINSLKFK